MKKIFAFTAAAITAVTMTASAGAVDFAREHQAFQPAVVYIDNNEQPELINADLTADDEYGILLLENDVLTADETLDLTTESSQQTSSEEAFTAQDILKMIGISFVIGLVIALIVCLVMKSCMKTAVPKSTANDYIRKNSFNITRSRDIFIYSNITKKKRQKQEDKK